MTPKRGELYRLKPDSSGKRRPVVIVSRNEINGGHSLLAVPFYSKQVAKRKTLMWCAHFQVGEGGLDQECVAKTDEISLIDKLDIDLASGPIGSFDESQMQRLFEALELSLGIS